MFWSPAIYFDQQVVLRHFIRKTDCLKSINFENVWPSVI